ncbi:MAG: hypothetical protein A2177_08725 [Spirochaetes bacterium RBG_13_68_11]|nr:MAG: hypothetical protein A2177_08725 [Spirochaetes bacterium RBG_13_68_11]
MTGSFLSRVLRGYREIGARAGFLALLVVLSAALGALVALPLWLFATASPPAYTAAVLAAAAVAAGAAVIRRILRTGVSWPRAAAKALAVLLALAKVVLLLAGLYAAAAFTARRLYLPAAAGGLVFLAAAAWIGYGVRSSAPNRREAPRGARAGTPPNPPGTIR